MYRASDHPDGSEPHGLFMEHRATVMPYSGEQWCGEVYPGWCSSWVPGRVLYRYPA